MPVSCSDATHAPETLVKIIVAIIVFFAGVGL
jgi:hypothetical protein